LHVDRGQWRLSPAFDVNPFPDRVRELKTWISLETGPEATINALMSVTTYFRISQNRARAILAEVECAVSGWRDEARALSMTADDLDAFADAFEHKERAAAQRAVR
jgi:serine/threonine-protein kinase HipA